MPDATRPSLTINTAPQKQLRSPVLLEVPSSGVALTPLTPGGFEILLITPMGPYRLPSYVHYLERTKEYAEWIARKQSAIPEIEEEPIEARKSGKNWFRRKSNSVPKPLPLQLEETSQSIANFMDRIGMKEAVKKKATTPSRLTRLKDTTKVLVTPLMNRSAKNTATKSPTGVKTVVSGRHFQPGTKLVMINNENDNQSESGESG